MDIENILLKVQKPAWYSGGEYGSVIKNPSKVDVRFAFCFPDLYEIGMSHLGIKILYHCLNQVPNIWCERVFMPNLDMEEEMKKEKIPLFGLESRDPIKDFDFVGFTMQYEMSYTNVLNMLSLAQIPLFSKDRKAGDPIIIAGGPCTCNPEPIADFIDVFSIGEGEEHLKMLSDLYLQCGKDREEFLRQAAKTEGTYVPKYPPETPVKMQKIENLDTVEYPDRFVVPFTQVVHDRVMLEIMRGCVRGCRFCQAGFLYRPFRQKSPEVLIEQANKLCRSTGYDEISLTSLSTSDYDKLPELCDNLLFYCMPQNINLSLPSLRVDNFTKEILEKVQATRKSGLTFAPEAGTQRLRDVINKNVTEQEIENTCRIAFEGGCSSVKLYFMIGLPTETDEDIKGIADTAQKIVDLYYSMPNKPKGKGIQVTISLATFVPKPFTPFQWESQISLEEIERKQKYLKSLITSRKIKLNYHDGKTSVIEGVLARGDRRLSQVLLRVFENGGKLDSWDEHFSYERWINAIKDSGLTVEEYAGRKREYSEPLPWDIIDIGVTKEFFIRENKNAYLAKTTPSCKLQCAGCGITKLCKGDVCPAVKERKEPNDESNA